MENATQNDAILIRPKVTMDEAKQAVFNLYGLEVRNIYRLNGYDDRNFHVLVTRERKDNEFINRIFDDGYVLKIINTLDSLDVAAIEAQTELLVHLKKNNIRCPEPIPTKTGKPSENIQLSSGVHAVRLLEYISGDIVYKVPCTARLLKEVGVLAAQIDNALQTFDHPAYHKKIKWCLGAAPRILDCLYAVKDPPRQHLVRRTIDEFCSRVLTVENQLNKGIIHGDINEQNLLVAEEKNKVKVKAVIDFGDVHHTCYLYELAIAMTYMIFTSNDIDSGGYVLAGYASVRKVTELEYSLLRICVMTRFCQSLVLGAHASLQEPGNEYILTTAKRGWELLEMLSKNDDLTTVKRWRSYNM